MQSDEVSSEGSIQYGFLAQDVRNVYPALVGEDSEGKLAIDYQGFIPLLLEAVNKLQATVDRQEKIIETLLGNKPQTLSNDDNLTQASISQNRPNPTNGECIINFSIPEDAVTAYIELASSDGLTNRRFDIGERGNGTLKVDASALTPGVYVYTLIVDSQEIGSHRMIVAY